MHPIVRLAILGVIVFVVIKFWTTGFDLSSVWRSEKPFDDVPLDSQKIWALNWGPIQGNCMGHETKPGCDRVNTLILSNQYKILWCQYGPSMANDEGWREYYFWYEKVPDDFRQYAVVGDDHPFVMLGTMALMACPKTLAEAQPVYKASRLKTK